MTDMEEILIENSVDLMDTVASMFSAKQLIACTVGGVAAGLFVGAFSMKLYLEKKLGEEFEARVEQEVEATKRVYNTLHKVDIEPEDLASKYPESKAGETPKVVKEAAAALVNYQGYSAKAEEVKESEGEEAAELVRNIFPEIPGEPDFSTEVSRRNEDYPYIISQDEFYNDEKDYEHDNLTYFEGDGTLVDTREMPIEEVDEVVGEDNLTRFGQWSKDPNIVHVRNDRLRTDMEIVRSERSFGEEVGGFIEHSYDPGPRRKFRRGDDE